MRPTAVRSVRPPWTGARGFLSGFLLLMLVMTSGAGNARAADTPDGAVLELLAAVDEGSWTDIPTLICSERDVDAGRRLDLSQVVVEVPAEFRTAALRAIDVRVTRIAVETLETEGRSALVRMTASIATSLDRRILRRALMGSVGGDGVVDDAVLRSLQAERIADRMGRIPATVTLDEEIRVEDEAGAWRVCSDIGWGLEPLDPSNVCDLISASELSLVVPWPVTTSTPSDSACTYAADDGSRELSSISIWVEEGSLEVVRAAFPSGTDVEIQGVSGFLADDAVRLDLGGRLLVIQVTAIGKVDVDRAAIARTIAQVVVTRIDR